MACIIHILAIICGFVFIPQISVVRGQLTECHPTYAVKPNATCWRPFPNITMVDCSHKFCYKLTEGAAKCEHPWRKPTIHREHELERIATLARNEFVTQQSCTMRVKVNKHTKHNLLFFQHEDNCLGLETFTLSHDSCAVVHLNRALSGYCIWYHDVCPKVPSDITVCKRDKDVEISTNSPTHGTTVMDVGPLDKSSLSIEIIIIVAVSANFIILIIVALLVSFLLKRFRTTNRHDPLTGNPSNRPLPRVPNETGKKVNHKISKADSAEFDKLKDESHYMYLSHESMEVPRYDSITRDDVRKTTGSDKQSLERMSYESDYMALMKDKKLKHTTKEIHGLSEKSTTDSQAQNVEKNYQPGIDYTDNDVNHQRIKSVTYPDTDGEYSELKTDYYVLEENDTNNDNETVFNADDRTGGRCHDLEPLQQDHDDRTGKRRDDPKPIEQDCDDRTGERRDDIELIEQDRDDRTGERGDDLKPIEQERTCVQEEENNREYFQLENDGNETEEISRSSEEVENQDNVNDEQF